MNLQQRKTIAFWAIRTFRRFLLKLSLPNVTAQVINMLYNIVDRIYIGHIPETGAGAHRRRGMYASDRDRICLCSLGWQRRCPQSFYFYGKGDKESAEQTLGNCFYYPDCCIIAADSYPFLENKAYGIWCQKIPFLALLLI